MTAEVDTARRVFVSYIDASREYYQAQGYGNPYRWAYHQDSPFAALPKPLRECRLGLVTTASLVEGSGEPTAGDVPRVVYAAPLDPSPRRLSTEHRFWDREATHTDDVDTFLPINRLAEHVAAGRLAGLAPRFYGVPTEYSQRRTVEFDAPEVLRLCREDKVDVAMLVPL